MSFYKSVLRKKKSTHLCKFFFKDKITCQVLKTRNNKIEEIYNRMDKRGKKKGLPNGRPKYKPGNPTLAGK